MVVALPTFVARRSGPASCIRPPGRVPSGTGGTAFDRAPSGDCRLARGRAPWRAGLAVLLALAVLVAPWSGTTPTRAQAPE